MANKYHSGNKVDRKHYWLTPRELREPIEAEFGQDLFDPCPYPKPEDFDGLTCDWQKVNYLNMPFGSVIVNGKKVGPTAWIRKAIEEQARGNTTLIPWPMDGWFHMLLAAGVEIRSLGEVKWLATEDGTPQKGSSRQIVLFVLRGANHGEKQSEATGADCDSFVSKAKREERKLDALETTNAIRGKTSSEIKQLIANPKAHSYDLVALKVALSAKLSKEAEAPR
jgi:hypothetical protein